MRLNNPIELFASKLGGNVFMEKILDKIVGIAKRHSVKVYAVGGPVRDILLGKEEFGIDIAVEGDGIEFAKILQKELGSKLLTHSKFGTASLILATNKRPTEVDVPIKSGTRIRRTRALKDKSKCPSGLPLTIDIASCREEEYPESAKLPNVRMATLQDDLKRRDFTINAMALDLETDDLIDPFRGKKDLEAELIRVLHPNSFIDDPTRIFRAIRFAGRLGFKLEPKTASLARKAIKDGLITKLTPKRIRNEITLILKEPERERILELMNEFKILKQLGFKLPPPNLFRNIDETSKLFAVNGTWFTYLLGILDFSSTLTFELIEFTRHETQKIVHACIIISNISKFESANKPSEIYKLLEGAGNEELLFIASAYSESKSKILKFLNVYKKVKIRITGKDLIKLGIEKSPLYKELLTTTLYAKLDGKLHTKKDELEFIQNFIDKSNKETIRN